MLFVVAIASSMTPSAAGSGWRQPRRRPPDLLRADIRSASSPISRLRVDDCVNRPSVHQMLASAAISTAAAPR
jgi:hypothetical protein